MIRQSVILLACLCGALGAFRTAAGTLIYLNSEKEEKIVSDVKILSINGGLMKVEIDKGVRTLPMSRVVKYYDTDVDVNSFDDDTAEYTVAIRDLRVPERGVETTKNKRSVSEITLRYSVNKNGKNSRSNSVRVPYFYFFVLTTSGDAAGGRAMYAFAHPANARSGKMKNYDEALMMKAAFSAERNNMAANPDVGNYHERGANVKSFGDREVRVKLTGVGNRRIIACHIVVWGKDKVVTEEDWTNPSFQNVGKNWWLQRYNNNR